MTNIVKVLVLWFFAFPVFAETYYVAPPPLGKDSNDCRAPSRPCGSLQRAVDLIKSVGLINIAHGTYRDKGVNVIYYKVVTFIGDCEGANNQKVNLVLKGNDVAFRAQDYAIIGVNCLSISTRGEGSRAFSARQFAIIDYKKVRLGEMPLGVHVEATEKSKINCLGGVEIMGGAVYHAAATQQSQINLNCDVVIAKPVKFDAFAWVTIQSLIEAGSAVIGGAGASTSTGFQFINDSSQIILPPADKVWPGIGSVVQFGGIVKGRVLTAK